MDVVEEIKARADISAILSRYVDLKRAGSVEKGLCPFHSEKTPSFVVYPARGLWRCFGSCSTGGDVFSFLMRADKIEFKEALRRLAQITGVPYETRRKAQNPEAQRVAKGIGAANQVAADWFKTMLKSNMGEDARTYLEKRGVSETVAQRRGIGFAPGSVMTLKSKLETIGVDWRDADRARLLTGRDYASAKDFFNNRVTFEIHDAKSRLVGFGARTMDDAVAPKYINTPQTPLFNKSAILYGLNWASESIQRERRAVVVEGYMDVVTAHENGFTNVVASMGVAITERQLELLMPLTSGPDSPGEVILCLDTDTAGQEATLKALSDIVTVTVRELSEMRKIKNFDIENVKVARLSSGKDPDELIKQDPRAWSDALDNAQSLGIFLIDTHSQRLSLTNPQDRRQFIEAVTPLINAVYDDYRRDVYFKRVAELLQVDEARLKATLFKPAPLPQTRRRSQNASNITPDRQRAENVSPATLNKRPRYHLEDHLLCMLLRYEDLRELARDLPGELFEDTLNRLLFSQWKADELNGTADIDETITARVAKLNSIELIDCTESDRITEFNRCVSRLRERYFKGTVLTELQQYMEADVVAENGTPPLESVKELKTIYETRERRHS